MYTFFDGTASVDARLRSSNVYGLIEYQEDLILFAIIKFCYSFIINIHPDDNHEATAIQQNLLARDSYRHVDICCEMISRYLRYILFSDSLVANFE